MNALFNMGFRPFFLGAGIFAVLSMGWWGAVFRFGQQIPLNGLTPSQWHAHEMIYGYALAVIAGFLLTATRNWTGMATLSGKSLAFAFACWGLARVLLLGGTSFIVAAAVADLLFVAMVIGGCAVPIVRARQWRQIAIVSKLILLGIGNALFYAALMGWHEEALRWSIHGALYLVIGLILTMGRRLIPFFTERGVSPPVQLRNSKWLDIASLLLFLVFWVSEVFLRQSQLAGAACVALFLVNAVRLAWWHTPGIWSRPLLWSIFVSFALIDLAFLLHALSVFASVDATLALHLFAIGGIGVMTLGMMARVALGHTGRSVQQPPRIVIAPLALLLLATALRVAGPLLLPQAYLGWILMSQIAWMLAFAVFCVAWWPMLTQPRSDGAPG
jgi:uncharacterized protein involved in response to NO